MYGNLSEMNVSLGNFRGEKITCFSDLYGHECSFQEYLKSHGIISSKLHLYLLTCSKNEYMNTGANTHTGTFYLAINDHIIGEPGILYVKYTKDTADSSLNEVRSRLNCYSYEQCAEVCFDPDMSKDYDPFDDGFYVSSIVKNEKSFLEFVINDEAESFQFPQWKEKISDEQIILHGPDTIHGFDGGVLLLGIVSSLHGKGHEYVWIKDGNVYTRGEKRAVIRISEAGLYSGGICVGENMYLAAQCVYVSQSKLLPSNERSEATTTTENVGKLWTDLVPSTGTVCSVYVSQSKLHPSNERSEATTTKENVGKLSTDLVPSTGTVCSVYVSQSKLHPSNERSEATTTKENVGKLSTDLVPSTRTTCTIVNNLTVPSCKFENFKIIDEIGKGAFGTVYKAEWLGAVVATKVIPVKRMKMARSVIDRELVVHSKIRHPRIVQLVTYCINGDKLYMVSEFVNGPNLDAALFGCEYDGLIKLEYKRPMAVEIVSALAYLHNFDPAIIHRDIKPENIVIEKATLSCKLCDLGVSKVQSLNSTSNTVGAGAEQPGTAAYQAPEILVKRKSASKSSDVWSLACTIFELYSEVQIWGIDEFDTIIDQMKELLSPSGLKDGKHLLPEPVINIVSQALQYRPEERPNAVDFLDVLQNLED